MPVGVTSNTYCNCFFIHLFIHCNFHSNLYPVFTWPQGLFAHSVYVLYISDGKENASPQPENGATAKDETSSLCFLHPVASIHVALCERQARRKALFASSGPYKRALSARRDLAIRLVVAGTYSTWCNTREFHNQPCIS